MKRFLLWVIAVLIFAVSLSAQNLGIYCENDAPFQFMGPDGKLTGMNVEFVQEIQKRVGNTDPIQMVPWARGLAYLDTKPNTVLFSMSRTAERNELYQWVGPVAEVVFGLYAKADSSMEIKSLDDAKKLHIIGVYRDDIRDQYLTRNGFTNLERTKDNVQNFRKLMAGRIDAYVSTQSSVIGEAGVSGYKPSDVKLVYELMKSQVFIAMSKATDSAIVAQWRAALESMKKDGSFKRILKKYYPANDLPGPEITKF